MKNFISEIIHYKRIQQLEKELSLQQDLVRIFRTTPKSYKKAIKAVRTTLRELFRENMFPKDVTIFKFCNPCKYEDEADCRECLIEKIIQNLENDKTIKP